MFATSTRCPSGDVKPQLTALILVSELRACGECAWKGGPGGGGGVRLDSAELQC